MNTDGLQILINAASAAGEGAFWLVIWFYAFSLIQTVIVCAVPITLLLTIQKCWQDTRCLHEVRRILGVKKLDGEYGNEMGRQTRDKILAALQERN